MCIPVSLPEIMNKENVLMFLILTDFERLSSRGRVMCCNMKGKLQTGVRYW